MKAKKTVKAKILDFVKVKNNSSNENTRIFNDIFMEINLFYSIQPLSSKPMDS